MDARQEGNWLIKTGEEGVEGQMYIILNEEFLRIK